jgi:SAM-dependent methyltransferase
MHFGYWRPWMSPLALEAMLEEMSRQVFRRLAPRDGDRVLDLGCGVGAPARTLIAEHAVDLIAVTKVGWQIAMANRLGPGDAPRGTVEWKHADFDGPIDLPDGSCQGAFSIEASCHSPGASKEPFVRECARLLAPGARLVVADGFMKSADPPRWYAAMLGFMTRSWAVERFAGLAEFTAALERHGMTVEAVEDASFRIAPSVLHVPRVTLKFLAGELLRRRWPSRARWNHVLACVVAPLVGLGRPWFGYYLVTARKR